MFSMLRFTLVFVLQFSIICLKFSFSSANAFIGHNIKVADENEFPFVVSIKYKNSRSPPENNHFCTGSLITAKLVLTAAHCVEDEKSPSKIEVLIGSNSLQKGISHDVIGWITYNEWVKLKTNKVETGINDIAIITLKDAVDTKKVQIGALSKKLPRELYDTSATLVGWGDNDSGQTPTNLQKTTVKILSNSGCEEKLKAATRREQRHPTHILCSDADPWVLVSCGDSGGPILDEKNAIAGVCEGDCPSVNPKKDLSDKKKFNLNRKKVNTHFSVHHYRDFIADVMTLSNPLQK